MKQIKKIISMMVLGLVLMFCNSIYVQAARVTQTAQTTNSVTVNFNVNELSLTRGSTLTGWTVTLQKYDNGNRVDVQPAVTLPANTTSYVFSNLTPGTSYYAKVEYSYKTSYGKAYTNTFASQEIKSTPGKVTGLHQAQWWYYIEKVDFAWDEQNACSYEWVAYQKKKQVANGTSLSSASGSFNVKNNKLYTVKVRAYVDINGQKVYGDWSDETYLFTQPMISKKGISISGGKMKVKWGKIDGVNGYDVYVSTKEKSGHKKVASVKASKGSVTIKKFKKKKFNKKKTYYVYVVAKKKVGSATYDSGRHYSTQYKKGNTKLMWSFSER